MTIQEYVHKTGCRGNSDLGVRDAGYPPNHVISRSRSPFKGEKPRANGNIFFNNHAGSPHNLSPLQSFVDFCEQQRS